jgi:hypothetical protein
MAFLLTLEMQEGRRSCLIAELYLPSSFKGAFPGRKAAMVKDPVQIRENIFSTGELEGVEQLLALKTAKGMFVLTGCAHSGMEMILAAAAKFGNRVIGSGLFRRISLCLS